MDPLTLITLDRMSQCVDMFASDPNSLYARDYFKSTFFDIDSIRSLIAAARALIPRPISEAPRDGTEVIIHDGYDRFQNATFAHGFWFSKVTGEIIHDPIAFLPIPKGGAS